MANSIGTVFAEVRADTAGFDNDIDHAGRGWIGSFGSIGAKAAKAFAVGAAAVGVGAAIFGKQAVSAASDFNETLSKSNTIFGESAAAIEAWSSDAAQNFGQSQTSALDAAGSFGNMFVQLGIGQEQAAGMSTSMTELASDFASFHNADITEVISAQTAAFRGEYDAVQRFVPTINAAAVEAKALEMGLAGSTKELTAQDKALAVNTLLMDGAGDAMGDFARTSGGLANQQRTLGAAFSDIKVTVGQFLLPIMTSFVTFLNSSVIPSVYAVIGVFNEQGLAGVFDLVRGKISEALPGIKTAIGDIASSFVSWVQDVTPPLLVKLGELLASLGRWLLDTGLPFLGEKLKEWGQAFVDWIGPKIVPALQELGRLVGALGTWVLDEGLPLLADKLKEWGSAFLKWIGPMIPPLLLEVGKLLFQLNNWILFDALPKLVAKLAEWGLAFVGWITQAGLDLLPKLGEFASKIGNWLKDDAPGLVADKAQDFGKAIIEGIVAGLSALGRQIRDKIMSFVPSAGDIVGAVGRVAGRVGNALNPFAATGGVVTKGGWTMIGEDGPEWLRLPTGAQIASNEFGNVRPQSVTMDVSRLVSPGSAGAQRSWNLTVNTSDERAVDVLKREMRRQELLNA